MYDIMTLARTIYGEARGETQAGMQAVACVVLNRQRDPKRWPNDIATVCRQQYQFSCWLERDPNRAKIEAVDHRDPVFAQCYAIAALAFADMLEDNTQGANHYMTTKLFESERCPKWADPAAETCRVDHHVFFAL